MINGERVLAVIPARGGSKRCPMKNIRPFRGTELIAWTIGAANATMYVDIKRVSTEDPWIANRAEKNGGIVRMRPPELATDEASNEDVLRDCLKEFNGVDEYIKWVVLLQPTSPLRSGSDIDFCIEIATQGDACVSYRADGTKNGAVYVARVSWLMAGNNFDAPHLKYIMPDSRSLDIDYPEDFNK